MKLTTEQSAVAVGGARGSAAETVIKRTSTSAPRMDLRRANFHVALGKESLAETTVQERSVTGQGVDIFASSPADFTQFLAAQMTTWRRVVRENNIRND